MRVTGSCFVWSCRLHYRVFLKGLTPYALIANLTFFIADGATYQPIMTKSYGLPNGPDNPTGGFGVPYNGTLFALTA
jgi:hypothetical protein